MVLTCAEQTTYRHSHVGSAGSPTVIVSGGDTNIKGAQVTGKGITVRATNFNIESLQDTADQTTAAVSDKLGNTQSYERYQAAKTLLEAKLQNTDSEAEKAAIRSSLGQVNAYLAENQSRYDTWKEGGIGRSILHGAAGGLTTGNLGGILAGGGTSLAAPYLDKAAENLGPAGKAAVNALGGAAIGYAAGGNVGTAAAGANVDWNNRQLHPKEMALADKYAEALKREVEKRDGRKISSQEAAMRIRRQILRWVDKGSQDGYTDQTVISTIGMKGEDKALGYTWDYRNYGARNPQAFNDPNLFAEYLIQEKPLYRNLKQFHSGIRNSEIQRNQQENENFALNVADTLLNLVNPNPRIKAPILAGIRNLGKIRSNVTGSDPLLAGAGNIRIPANGNVAKGDRIQDTALAAKNHSGNDLRPHKESSTGSSVPVPSETTVTFRKGKDSYELKYQSNEKHSLGHGGKRPGHEASLEPKNSLELFQQSISVKDGMRVTFDKSTGEVHQFFSGTGNNRNLYHWAGTLNGNRIDKLNIQLRRKLGIPGK